ncbi:alpha/beta fold hydrolase [bacterium]|nr:alpha/beta fold hydrolase [bacterium]
MHNLFFLHGLESSPNGTKAQLIRKKYPECTIPELTPNIKERDEVLKQLISEPSWIIGSSLGGLSALLFAMSNPELVKAMILLAPAVGFYDPDFFDEAEMKLIESTYIPNGIPTTIIAGEYDDVIPMSSIEDLIKRSPDKQIVSFIKVKDDHSLNQFPGILMDCIVSMFF